MNKRNIFTEEIIETLCNKQNITEEDVQHIRNENEGLPDGIFAAFCLIHFMKNSATTDWKSLLEGIENLMVKNADEDQMLIVTQYILETLSNSVSNGHLDAKLLTPYLGPLSRNYLNEYEDFHGTGYKF